MTPGQRGSGLPVALVSEHASPLAVLGGVDAGGQNVHVAALAQALADRGADVRVYTRRDDPDLPREVEALGGVRGRVRVVHVDAGPPRPVPKDELLPHMDAFALELARDWRREPPAVVHAHFWMSGLASVQAARPLGIPVLQTFHALGIVKRRQQGVKDTSPPVRVDIERMLAREVDQVLATCSDEVFELLHLGADGNHISVVPCGVDLGAFRPVGPVERRGATGRRHRLVVVSRLVERKGIGNVISALPALPTAELVIAGGPERCRVEEDPEARRLLQLAAELGVADRVDFRGRVERADVPALLRSADVCVCVPWYEPFGIVPLEAMACGVPVLASAVGGLIDTVVDGSTGIHVPARRPDLVAGALRRLLADDDLRSRLGRSGAARAQARYGWDRVAHGSMAAYTSVLRSARAREGALVW